MDGQSWTEVMAVQGGRGKRPQSRLWPWLATAVALDPEGKLRPEACAPPSPCMSQQDKVELMWIKTYQNQTQIYVHFDICSDTAGLNHTLRKLNWMWHCGRCTESHIVSAQVDVTLRSLYWITHCVSSSGCDTAVTLLNHTLCQLKWMWHCGHCTESHIM